MKVVKNLQLEGLRGLASIWVFASHLLAWESFSSSKLVNTYFTGFMTSFTPAHLGVLYFFILSGYVMGKAYHWNNNFLVLQYLTKRWVRIWPMYAIAVLFSCIVSPSSTSIVQVIGHLLFLNSDVIPPLLGNPVLWSISYEFWFYLLLPIIFAIPFVLKNKGIPILAILILISIFSYNISPSKDISMIFRWLEGSVFWMIGLVIAWTTKINDDESSNSIIDNKNLCAGLFMSMAFIPCGAALISIFKSAKLPDLLGHTAPSIGDFIYLPTVLTVFYCATKSKVPKQIYSISFFASLVIVMSIIFASLINGRFWIMPTYPAVLFIVILAIVAKYYNLLNFDLESLAPVGSISYGIYIFHMPTMIFIGKIPSFSQGWFEWLIRAIVSIIATFFIAYILEIKFQPRFREYFIHRFS
jgi:peptidoglycan/LPS O-acetylase OafA/YrhL